MDRRSTIAALVGKKTKASTAVAKQFSAPVIAGGMDPYTGPWNFEQAAHLLRRATFGPSLTQLKKAQQDGLNATLNKLFTPVNITGPLNSGQYLGQRDAMNQPPATNDPYVPVGQPWVKKEAGKWKAGWYDVRDTTTRNRIQAYRRQTLRSWILESIIKEETSIIQTMTLFWHNHFVTAETNDPVFEFRYLATLTDNCLGDFKELVKQITIDPAMLFYLNGNVNTGNSPNENYARELFELFTIGKGPLVGPGDYSNYTEDDIREAAKVLSGWRVYGLNATQIVSDKDANGGYFENLIR